MKDPRQVLINLIAGLSLADHMGDAADDCKHALKQIGIDWEKSDSEQEWWAELAEFLARSHGAETVWGTSLLTGAEERAAVVVGGFIERLCRRIADKRERERLLRDYGGYQGCTWCERPMAASWKAWPANPSLDELTCSKCGGTSIWLWGMGFHYMKAGTPPPAKFPDDAFSTAPTTKGRRRKGMMMHNKGPEGYRLPSAADHGSVETMTDETMVTHPLELLRSLTENDIERAGRMGSTMIRTGLLSDLLDELARHRLASTASVDALVEAATNILGAIDEGQDFDPMHSDYVADLRAALVALGRVSEEQAGMIEGMDG